MIEQVYRAYCEFKKIPYTDPNNREEKVNFQDEIFNFNFEDLMEFYKILSKVK